MTAPVIDLRPWIACDLEQIRADLADTAADIGLTAKDLCYSSRRSSVAILRANHEALGQLIERLTQRGEP